MSSMTNGTLIITGPTGGLGKELALQVASRSANDRPDMVLVGRPGQTLTEITRLIREAGVNAYEIACDLSRLSDVRVATKTIQDLLASNKVRPLHAIVANAGLSSADTREMSADGYELTFAVNYLAHAQLINGLKDTLVAPGRIVMVGSDTYYENTLRKLLHVAPADWRDPLELARPASANTQPTIRTSGTAYSNSKLAIFYYAHELQRHVKDGISVIVFEPGFMPGTGLSRNQAPAAQSLARMIGRFPGVSKPATSAPMFASVALDEKWSHLRGGDYVFKNKLTEVKPFAHDRERELRLWQATNELLEAAK